MWRMTIQQRLRAMKQIDASKKCGLSRPFVAQIARGVRTPSVVTIARISTALGCSDEEIGASVREWASAEPSSESAA